MIKTKRNKLRITTILMLIASILLSDYTTLVNIPTAKAVNNITFPVLGGGRYSNDYTAPRFNGLHHATDVLAPKHTPIVSPVDGTIYYLMYPQPSWGYSVGIRDADGYEFNLLHLNNDNDGTNDNNGGPMKAYAPDMKVGNKVVKGQHLGWLGDSGYANNIPHLHFEMYDPDKNPMNPYEFLRQSTTIYQPTIVYPTQDGESLPYGAGVNTSVQLAAGNLDADPQKEYVTGTGKGSTPHVRVFNSDYSFDDYGFFAYASNYLGGVNVATGDIDGDGIDEIITGTGPGSTTHIKAFSLSGVMKSGFFAYPGYYVGADVASGDVDGDGTDEIVTSPAVGSTHVKIFKPTGELNSSFFAYPGFYGGTRLDVGNVKTNTAKEEIITAPYSNGGPDIRLYDNNGSMVGQLGLYESWWSGGYDVSATEGLSIVGTGGSRRSSVRIGPN